MLHIIIYVGDTASLLTFKVDILATLHERLILFVSSYRFDLASRLTGLSFDPVSTILFRFAPPFLPDELNKSIRHLIGNFAFVYSSRLSSLFLVLICFIQSEVRLVWSTGMDSETKGFF